VAAACSATERRNQAGLLLPPRTKTGAVILPNSTAGHTARGDGEVVGQRVGQWYEGRHPRGAVQLRQRLFRQPDHEISSPRRAVGKTSLTCARNSVPVTASIH